MKYEHQSLSAPVWWINYFLKFTAMFADMRLRERSRRSAPHEEE